MTFIFSTLQRAIYCPSWQFLPRLRRVSGWWRLVSLVSIGFLLANSNPTKSFTDAEDRKNSVERRYPDSLHLPHVFSAWTPVMKKTRELSKACPDFIHYTVWVHSRRAEAHHHSITASSARVGSDRCAVLLILQLSSDEETVGPWIPDETVYTDIGWVVFSANTSLPAVVSRRVSRFPKLFPAGFFPHTRIVLYSDMKLLPKLVDSNMKLIASRLLQSTQFGIVQHPTNQNLMAERAAIIMSRNWKRPFIVDSSVTLDIQTSILNHTLTEAQQHQYGIEGRLHARVINDKHNSTFFDRMWMDEYNNGCDRDQIAFFGAAARAQMEHSSSFPCQVYNRSGTYRSNAFPDFSFAIHCSLETLLIDQ